MSQAREILEQKIEQSEQEVKQQIIAGRPVDLALKHLSTCIIMHCTAYFGTALKDEGVRLE